MRIAIALGAVLATAAVVLAQPLYVPFEVKVGTNAATVAVAKTDVQNPIGYVDEILLQAPTTSGVAVASGVATAVVTVVSNPNVGSGLPPTVLYSNAAMTTSSGLFRPRVAQQDSAGTNVSASTVLERFLCAGDPVTFRVAQTSVRTQVVYKGWIKIDQ